MDEKDDVKKLFKEADRNGDGFITRRECEFVFKNVFPDWAEEDFSDLFDGADVNSDGLLNYCEFIDWLYDAPAESFGFDPPSRTTADKKLASLIVKPEPVILKSEVNDVEGKLYHPELREERKREAQEKRRAAEEEDADDTSARVCVESKFGNLAGVFAPEEELNEGRSVFKREASDVYLVFADGCWRMAGDPQAKARFPNCEIQDEAEHPADAQGGWTDGLSAVRRLRKAASEKVAAAPQMLGITTQKADTGQFISNIGGGFKRVDDYMEYPCYKNDDSGLCLFHDLTHGEWILGNEPGGNSSYSKVKCNVASPAHLSGEWDSGAIVFNIYEVTWDHGIDDTEGFEDPDFPADSSSLGADADCKWIRAKNIVRGREVKLFDGIEPSDLLQGGLGDCWLVSAVACVAEYPDRIQRLFKDSSELADDGKYTISLWDLKSGDWKDIEIDDRVPCKAFDWWQRKATTLYAHPPDGEIWPVLLEKAFAKLHGTYAAMDGGNSAWAWQAMTGCSDCIMMQRSGTEGWKTYTLNLEAQKTSADNGEYGCRTCPFSAPADAPFEYVAAEELGAFLANMDSSNYVMGVSVKGNSGEKVRDDGLVENHAYSLLRVQQDLPDGVGCMAQLRNPWGNAKEWRGAWADRSEEWTNHPEVTETLSYKPGDNGRFWMHIDDFSSIFDCITMCKCQGTA